MATLEAANHHEVLGVPMDDARKARLVTQRLGTTAYAAGAQTVATGRFDDVEGVRSVARDTTVDAHLLEREPLTPICTDHGQTGGAALKRLHLHHLGDPSRHCSASSHVSTLPDVE